jgi:hypothetical protein
MSYSFVPFDQKSGGSRGGKNGGKAREQYATIEKDNELFRGYYKVRPFHVPPYLV